MDKFMATQQVELLRRVFGCCGSGPLFLILTQKAVKSSDYGFHELESGMYVDFKDVAEYSEESDEAMLLADEHESTVVRVVGEEFIRKLARAYRRRITSVPTSDAFWTVFNDREGNCLLQISSSGRVARDFIEAYGS